MRGPSVCRELGRIPLAGFHGARRLDPMMELRRPNYLVLVDVIKQRTNTGVIAGQHNLAAMGIANDKAPIADKAAQPVHGFPLKQG